MSKVGVCLLNWNGMKSKQEYNREYYKKNKNEINKWQKLYYREHKEEQRKWHKNNYKKNREREIQARNYRKKNPDKVRENERRRYIKHKEKRLSMNRKYYKKNKTDIIKKGIEYQRLHTLRTRKRTFFGVDKRNRPNNCELCDARVDRLEYHHWNDLHIERGIWMCFWCHKFVEAIEKGRNNEDIKKYLDMKNILNSGRFI